MAQDDLLTVSEFILVFFEKKDQDECPEINVNKSWCEDNKGKSRYHTFVIEWQRKFSSYLAKNKDF